MIRQAQQSDSRGLAELHVASWQEAYEGMLPKEFLDKLSVEGRAASWESHLGSNADKVFLHFVGEVLVGFVAVCASRDADGEEAGEIAAIYYKKDAWGKGLASELMEQALQTLSDDGFKRITLWVLRENIRAVSFYRKFGFTNDGTERKFERDSVSFDEIRMVRS